MARPRKYPDELRERAVRLVFESKRPIAHVAQDLGVHKESLRHWVRQGEADSGRRGGLLTREEREERKRLPKGNAEVRGGGRGVSEGSWGGGAGSGGARPSIAGGSSPRSGAGAPLHGGGGGRLGGRADLPRDRRAGQHALRAQIPEAVPPRARRPRAPDRDRGCPQ